MGHKKLEKPDYPVEALREAMEYRFPAMSIEGRAIALLRRAVRFYQSTATNIVGCRFGLLVVVEYIGRVDGKTLWKCRCDCGNTKITRSEYLKRGDVKSCGCWSSKEKK